jgi:hypothetical protein
VNNTGDRFGSRRAVQSHSFGATFSHFFASNLLRTSISVIVSYLIFLSQLIAEMPLDQVRLLGRSREKLRLQEFAPLPKLGDLEGETLGTVGDRVGGQFLLGEFVEEAPNDDLLHFELFDEPFGQ